MTAETMNRRKALERVSVIMGGVLVPSIWTGIISGCRTPLEPNWSPKFLDNEEALLTELIVDVFIPQTHTPSASEAMVHRFIDEMLHGFLEKEEQEIIRHGLKKLQEWDFFGMDEEARINVLKELSVSEEPKNALFFDAMRSMALLGYFTSEVGATQALAHDPIPGSYEGCIPLNKYGGKTWSES